MPDNLLVTLTSNNNSKQKASEKNELCFHVCFVYLAEVVHNLPCAEALAGSAPTICFGITGSIQERTVLRFGII